MHRLPGAVKLLGLLGISGAVFLLGVPAMGSAFCLIILLSGLAGIPPWELLRGGGSLVVMSFLILCFRSVNLDPLAFNRQGALEAVIFIGRLFLTYAAGSLLFSVTTMMELRESIGAIGRLSLGISLMLGFLPRFFEAWETANLAWKARGGRQGLRSMCILIPLTTERMIESASETALALEARGFVL
jgi:energy-coupling factor transporter transmembrane protein EcfT